ncbi:MAG: ABC transporter substrate-binding protein, partial [Chloroflexi bacterium]|nr:ABC transporter substrate-binding protein [Chloroflexota bacterium]
MTQSRYWNRLQHQRISRRRLLAATGVGAAGLAIAAACGSGSDTETPATTASSPGVPKYGGRFKNATSAVIDTLDPHLSIAAGTAFFPRIYNLLVARSPVDPEFFYYDLATKFEQPDETTWIFSLRPGVKIAPNELGVPERDMDAVDLFESFERIKSLPESTAAGFVKNWFESHEASADGMTYTITTPSPYAWFFFNLGMFTSMTPPRELLEGDVERLRTSGVGGGAFSVQPGGYTEGERLVMNKNPNYYRTDPTNNDAQLPYIDGMDLSIIPDRAGLRTAFLSAQTHTYMPESAAEADELTSGYDVYVASQEPVFWFVSITMNVEQPPFDNPDVRRAVMHSINRQQYIELIYGGGAQANGIVHWPTGAYALPPEELDELQKFDPELSKQLLTEAGFDLPLKVKVIFPSGIEIQELDSHIPIFLEHMRAAGFEVEQDPLDLGTWVDRYTDKNYRMRLSLNQIYET